MHPYLHEQMATAHTAELRRQASRSAGRPARGRRPGMSPARQRLGWLLVSIGLQLATDRPPATRGTWSPDPARPL